MCSSGGVACYRPQTCSPYRKWGRMTSATTPVSWFSEASWCGGRPIWAWQVVPRDVSSVCESTCCNSLAERGWEFFGACGIILFFCFLFGFRHTHCVMLLLTMTLVYVSLMHKFSVNTSFQSILHAKLSYDFRRLRILYVSHMDCFFELDSQSHHPSFISFYVSRIKKKKNHTVLNESAWTISFIFVFFIYF